MEFLKIKLKKIEIKFLEIEIIFLLYIEYFLRFNGFI